MSVNWRFHIPVFLGVAGGVFIVALVELRPVPQGLRDVALVLGGALIGLMSLWLDEMVRTGPERDAARKEHARERREDHERANALRAANQKLLVENEKLVELAKASEDRDRIRSEAEASSAYILGSVGTILPTKADLPNATDLIQGMCDVIQSLSADLGLRYSDEERKMLQTPQPGLAAARQISAMVRSRGRDLPQRLWCFFELGNRTPWLRDQAKGANSTKAAIEWLEPFRGNPFLLFAPRFVEVIHELIEIFRPYEHTVPDGAREALVRRVGEAFDKISTFYAQGRNTLTPYRRTPWFFTDDNGVGVLTCIIDNPDAPERSFGLGVRDPNTYELSEIQGDKITSTRVTCDEFGWHCSTHIDASAANTCLDIELVLAVTNGGNPPTEAEIVVGVRKDEDDGEDKGKDDGRER